MIQRIRISSYDPRWVLEFEAERGRISQVLGHLVRRIDHVVKRAMLIDDQSHLSLAAVMFTACLSSACWPARPSASQLAGAWEVDHEFGSETLVLSEDGSYRQTLTESGGRVVENQGRWQIQASRDAFEGSKVILHDALVFESAFGQREPNPPRQDWEFETLHEWGRTLLSFNPDLPGFHRK